MTTKTEEKPMSEREQAEEKVRAGLDCPRFGGRLTAFAISSVEADSSRS